MKQVNLVDSLLVQAQQKDGVEDRAEAKQRELNKVRAQKFISVHRVDARIDFRWGLRTVQQVSGRVHLDVEDGEVGDWFGGRRGHVEGRHVRWISTLQLVVPAIQQKIDVNNGEDEDECKQQPHDVCCIILVHS